MIERPGRPGLFLCLDPTFLPIEGRCLSAVKAEG